MRKCNLCERASNDGRMINNKDHGLLCSRCYQRVRSKAITYDLPNYGEVALSPDGKPICHICGKAYDKVLAHVWQIHEMSAYDYKLEFGLDVGKGIMSEESTELASTRLHENYDVVVVENLLEKGKSTRFTDGHKGRTKDLVSEQTRRRLVKQLKINDGRGAM